MKKFWISLFVVIILLAVARVASPMVEHPLIEDEVLIIWRIKIEPGSPGHHREDSPPLEDRAPPPYVPDGEDPDSKKKSPHPGNPNDPRIRMPEKFNKLQYRRQKRFGRHSGHFYCHPTPSEICTSREFMI